MSMRRKLAVSRHPAAVAARGLYRGIRHFSLPAPRAIVRPVLWVFLAYRATYYFLVRVLVCEPLFKAYCTSYGRGLRTGVYIHWIQGKGNIEVGDDVTFDGKTSISFAARYCNRPTLEVGDRSLISHGCSLTIGRRITIGRYCMLAGGVWMADSSGHPTDPTDRLAGLPAPDNRVRPIVVGDNVWIGTRAMILPGTTIGEGCVVAAGAVVRGELPPYSVVAGNPARVVATLDPPPKSVELDEPAKG